jgi:hypothetical protein
MRAVAPFPELLGWASGLEAAMYFYAAGCMLAYMLKDTHVTRDDLFAVGAHRRAHRARASWR